MMPVLEPSIMPIGLLDLLFLHLLKLELQLVLMLQLELIQQLIIMLVRLLLQLVRLGELLMQPQLQPMPTLKPFLLEKVKQPHLPPIILLELKPKLMLPSLE